MPPGVSSASEARTIPSAAPARASEMRSIAGLVAMARTPARIRRSPPRCPRPARAATSSLGAPVSVISTSTIGRCADHGQRGAPDLRGVADHDHAPRPLDHPPVGVGLDLVVGRHATSGGAVDPNEQQVKVDRGQRRVGERADQLVGLRARHAARDDEADRGRHDELGGDVHRVGHHSQLAVAKLASHLGGRRAAREPDGARVTDACGRGRGDAALLCGVLPTAVANRELVEGPVADGAAVGAREQLLLLEQLEVAPDRRGRGVEPPRQLTHSHGPVVRELLEDRLQPLGSPHSTTARRRLRGRSGSSPRRSASSNATRWTRTSSASGSSSE